MNTQVLEQKNTIKVGKRYDVATTADIMDYLSNKHGFEYDSMMAASVRKQENQGFQKHLVTMKAVQYQTDEGVPTIVIQNSYNGSTGLKIMSGYIRFACTNGLVFGHDISMVNMRHSQGWQQKVKDFVSGYTESVQQKLKEQEMMKNKYLSWSDQMRFAQKAVELRYSLRDVMDAYELNLVRREEDQGKDLWTTYNRVQESLVHGLFKRKIIHVDENTQEVKENWSQARKLTDSKEIVRVNSELYNLALEYV